MQVNSVHVKSLICAHISMLSASFFAQCSPSQCGRWCEEMLDVRSSELPMNCRELLQSFAAFVEKLGYCYNLLFQYITIGHV